VVGLVAGGTAMVVTVAGVLVWALTLPGGAFTSLADCAELMPAEQLDRIPHAEGLGIEGGESSADEIYAEVYGPSAEAVLDCRAAGGTDPETGVQTDVLSFSVVRFAPATEDQDYSEVQRAYERARRPLDRALDGAATGTEVEVSEGFAADVELRELTTGEQGHAVSYANVRAEFAAGTMDTWASATFWERNVIVVVTYSGRPEDEVGAKLDAAADIAALVGDRMQRTMETA
jgi:hypothetical protein